MTVRTGMSVKVRALFAFHLIFVPPGGRFLLCVRRRCEQQRGFCFLQSPARTVGWINMPRARCARPRARTEPGRSMGLHAELCPRSEDLWLATEHTRETQRLPKHPRQTLHPTIRRKSVRRRSLSPQWRFLTSAHCTGSPRPISRTPGRRPLALTRTGRCLLVAVARPLTWSPRLGRWDG